MRRESGFTNL